MNAYTITTARYAKGKFVIQSPQREDKLKSEVHWLCENIGGRWVHRDHGYQVSKRQAANFERLLKMGFKGCFRLATKQAAAFTHPATGLRKYTLKDALQSLMVPCGTAATT